MKFEYIHSYLHIVRLIFFFSFYIVQEIYTIVPKIGHNVGRPLGHMLSTDNLTTISKFKLHMQIDLDKRMNPLYFHDHETTTTKHWETSEI